MLSLCGRVSKPNPDTSMDLGLSVLRAAQVFQLSNAGALTVPHQSHLSDCVDFLFALSFLLSEQAGNLVRPYANLDQQCNSAFITFLFCISA